MPATSPPARNSPPSATAHSDKPPASPSPPPKPPAPTPSTPETPTKTSSDQRTATTTGGTTTNRYYLHDAIGSIVGLTDTTGNLADRYTYDPYGTTLTNTGTIPNPWTYASGYQDTTTGLTKYGTRYYKPTLGRWTQQDPIPGNNRYTYANNDPINNVDPTGLWSWTSFAEAIGGGAVGAAAGGCAAGAVATIWTGPGALAGCGIGAASGGAGGAVSGGIAYAFTQIF